MKYQVDIKHDSSLEIRFRESVKVLATETGSLNKRLLRCHRNYLYQIYYENFKEEDISDKLEYIANIFSDKNKCTFYSGGDGGWLHCNWRESKKMAENIFYIYERINEIINE